jgi:hypothetical protein
MAYGYSDKMRGFNEYRPFLKALKGKIMKAFDLKKQFTEGYGWNKDFKFEIIFSNSGTARIFINDRKTKYKAAGYGYDKTSTVIASMINDLIGKQLYSSTIYGNTGNYKKEGETEFLLSGGVGFSSIKESFESIEGNILNQIYSGKNSNIYEIKFNQREA